MLFSNLLADRLKIKDNVLIRSALKGEFRTRTKEVFRGRGLPLIKQVSDNNIIDELKIVSNYGYVDCKNSQIRM